MDSFELEEIEKARARSGEAYLEFFEIRASASAYTNFMPANWIGKSRTARTRSTIAGQDTQRLEWPARIGQFDRVALSLWGRRLMTVSTPSPRI
jgi:hypothetical protein